MKKLVVVLAGAVFFMAFCQSAVMAYVITFDAAVGLPYEDGEYIVYSPFGEPGDTINEGYLVIDSWVVVERIDGAPFRMVGFEGRSSTGEVSLFSDESGGTFDFLVGTDSFQSAIPPAEWDVNESFTFLSFWGIGEVDNLELASKTLIPKPTPSVPIPGAVWLLGAGISGIAAYRRKRS